MVKNWEIEFQDFNENVIETVKLNGITESEAKSFATEQAKTGKAHTYSMKELKEERWIKSKIAVILGLNNQYAGMCLVENPKDIKKVEEKYPFPYIIEVVEDIPNMKDFLDSKKD